MSSNRIFVALGLLSTALLVVPRPVAGQSFNPENGHSYFAFEAWMPYEEAGQLAALVDGTRVIIDDASEADWLTAEFGVFHWIGLDDTLTEGDFIWNTGASVTFSDWSPGQPADSSVEYDAVFRTSDGWATAPIDATRRPVIETEVLLLPPLSGLTCTDDGVLCQLLIDWEDGGYDEIRVYEDFELLAILPGTETSFIGEDAPTGYSSGSTYTLVGVIGGQLTVPVSCASYDPNPNYTIRIGDAVVVDDAPVDVSVFLDVSGSDPAQGFSLGVCEYPASSLQVESVAPGAASGPFIGGAWDFFSPILVDEGFALGVVFSFVGFETLAIGSDYEIVVASYTPLAPPPLDVSLEPCSTIGTPSVHTVVVAADEGRVPIQLPGTLTIAASSFIRGDCNADQGVNLADVLFLGTRLFDPLVHDYPCREACESNGDSAIDIADMVYSLSYLFSSGDAPVDPFPQCGADPDPPGDFGCEQGVCP